MVIGYKYIQAFSVDISLGGVVGALFVSKYLDVAPDAFLYIVLGLTIWLIYTFDHLLDARSDNHLVTLRHKIHRKYSATIWGIWSLTLVVAFTLLFKIPSVVVGAGILLILIVALYFISLKVLGSRKIFHKEILASIIYGTGIFLGPVVLFEGNLGIDFWILFLEYVLLAQINLLIFSLYELGIDQVSGFQSFVSSTGYGRAKKIIILLISILSFTALVTMSIFKGTGNILTAQFLIFLMSVALGLLLLFKKKLIINERFRFVGDAIFFIPLFYFLF